MKKILNYLPKWAKRLYARPKLKKAYKLAVDVAEELHYKKNERVFVLIGEDGCPTPVTKASFKEMKNKFPRMSKMSIKDLMGVSIYYTAGSYNREPMDKEEAGTRKNVYFKWYLDNIA